MMNMQMNQLNERNQENDTTVCPLVDVSYTPEEIEQILKAEQQREQDRYDELMRYRKNGEWEKFVALSLRHRRELLEIAFDYYKEVPDELKYDWAIDAYTDIGDGISAVRDAVITARKYGNPVLPDEWKDKEKITVYRAGAETMEEAEESISWTTDKQTAFFFYRRPYYWLPKHVWKAEIRPCDVIAYTNCRNEFEVMQYCKVMNLVDITEEAASEEGLRLAEEKNKAIKEHFDWVVRQLAQKFSGACSVQTKRRLMNYINTLKGRQLDGCLPFSVTQTQSENSAQK